MNMMFIAQETPESGECSNYVEPTVAIIDVTRFSKEAFKAWKLTTISKRQEILSNFFYQVLLEKEKLMKIICEEQRQPKEIVEKDFVKGLG